MRRREFITLLGGASVWPLGAGAQQAGKPPTIGFMGASTPSAWSQWTAAFVQRLRELGWIDGQTVAIEYRWAEGRSERFAEIAAEFVRLKVDVMVMEGTAATLAAKQATSVIPIVFPLSGDPLGAGLVASLARPGGNITGLSIQQTDIAGKRLDLLRELVPGLHWVGIMANPAGPSAVLDLRAAQAAARTLGLDVSVLETRRVEEIRPAIEAIGNRAQALYVCADPFTSANRALINELALTARLPTVHGDYVDTGGLMSYGASFSDMYRRTADLVNKILRGTKPGDIPVEQPTKFDLVINLKTAKALGLDVPLHLQQLADEVIE